MNHDIVAEFHEHDYYTTTELAEQLGVDRSTIVQWRIGGRIPASAVIKFRNKFYFRCDIIDPMIDAGEFVDADDPPHDFEGFKHFRNVSLLPYHFDRYRDLFLRRQAGCLPKGPAGGIRRNY